MSRSGGINRRELLGLGAVTALTGVVGTKVVVGDEAVADELAKVNFAGPHQAGIVTPQQRHLLLAVYDLDLDKRDQLSSLLRTLTDTGRRLTAGRLPQPESEFAPPPDSGVLGAGGDPAALTMTLGLGAGLFDRKGDPFGIAERRPRHLKAMEPFPGDDLDPAQTDGEFLIQLCSEDPMVNLHALRELERATRGALVPRVVQRGAQRISKIDPDKGEVAGARGLLGFKDGTANPVASDTKQMKQLVWLDGSERGEPDWTVNGSYMVVRKIRDRIEAWDRETLSSQERLFGRRRDSGAPLDGKRESDEPNYRADPKGEITPLDSHIRRANPRLAATERQRILRRGYPYFDGYDATGLLDAGLLFICFQRDIAAQFEAIKQRLSPRDAKPQGLDEYLTCVGGGYFFCPHGVESSGGFIGERLFS